MIKFLVSIVVLYILYKIACVAYFYNTDRCLKVLGKQDLIDKEITRMIQSKKGLKITHMSNSSVFQNMNKAYNCMINSDDSYGIRIGNGNSYIADRSLEVLSSDDYINNTFKEYKISLEKKSEAPIAVLFRDYKERGFSFIITEGEVLAFITGALANKFLACYKLSFAEFKWDTIKTTRSVVINEKTKNDIEYYYKFCPAQDATVITNETNWKVTNKDGSRSFRGGMLPENNPLIFKLLYSLITLSFGEYSNIFAFSDLDNSKAFISNWAEFRTPKNQDPGGKSDMELIDDLLNSL